jgi:hypothetical protein
MSPDRSDDTKSRLESKPSAIAQARARVAELLAMLVVRTHRRSVLDVDRNSSSQLSNTSSRNSEHQRDTFT